CAAVAAMVPALTALLDRVETKVRQARRRQGLQTGLAVLPLCLALGLLAATAVAVILPLMGVSIPEFVLPVAGLVLALVAAAAWAMSRRPDRTGAALALDRAFGLE